MRLDKQRKQFDERTAELRKKGIRLLVRRSHWHGLPAGPGNYCYFAELFDTKRKKVVGYGSAFCSPKDQPRRKLGYMIAVGRTLKSYDEGYNQ